MVSLFLGELYYFTASRRLILIVIGALLAFVCNVVRTAILVWAGTTSGPKSIEACHDPAGLTILMVCLLGLWLASLIMRRRGNASPIARSINNQRARIQLNWSLLGALAIWLLLVELGVQIWYRSHHTLIGSRWVVRWPESESHYKQVPVAPAAETLLRYNEGGAQLGKDQTAGNG
jgi:exosortase/archaeosortase family protein